MNDKMNVPDYLLTELRQSRWGKKKILEDNFFENSEF